MSADTTTILKAVEEQRCPLINVVSVVRCLKFSEEAGELAGALELVEQELERVLEALEGTSLERAAAVVTNTEGEPVMSADNVTPINRMANKPDSVLAALLWDIQFGTIGAGVATDALEKLEDELTSAAADDDGRGLYATLFLIREKLRHSIGEIEQACERARASIPKAEDAQP